MAIASLMTGLCIRTGLLGRSWRMHCWPDARPVDIPGSDTRNTLPWAGPAGPRPQAGTAIFFAGGMAAPPVLGIAVATLGGYGGSYTVAAGCALVSAVLLVLPVSADWRR